MNRRRSLVLLLALFLVWDLRAAQPSAPSRIVAIGDLHADIQATRKAFRTARASRRSAW